MPTTTEHFVFPLACPFIRKDRTADHEGSASGESRWGLRIDRTQDKRPAPELPSYLDRYVMRPFAKPDRALGAPRTTPPRALRILVTVSVTGARPVVGVAAALRAGEVRRAHSRDSSNDLFRLLGSEGFRFLRIRHWLPPFVRRYVLTFHPRRRVSTVMRHSNHIGIFRGSPQCQAGRWRHRNGGLVTEWTVGCGRWPSGFSYASTSWRRVRVANMPSRFMS